MTNYAELKLKIPVPQLERFHRHLKCAKLEHETASSYEAIFKSLQLANSTLVDYDPMAFTYAQEPEVDLPGEHTEEDGFNYLGFKDPKLKS